MRQIKASEIKPGMTIRWEQGGITYECAVSTVGPAMLGVTVMARRSASTIYEDTPVTVVSEPAPPQPEEPTEFGAKVTVDGEKFLRAQHPTSVPVPWLSESDGKWRNWPAILAMGPVTVIPDQGWTVPADTEPALEVPDRLEEWPGEDKALRNYEWRDRNGRPWLYSKTHGYWYNFSSSAISKLVTNAPKFGPWTRVPHA